MVDQSTPALPWPQFGFNHKHKFNLGQWQKLVQGLCGRGSHCSLGQCDLRSVMTFEHFAITPDPSTWGDGTGSGIPGRTWE